MSSRSGPIIIIDDDIDDQDILKEAIVEIGIRNEVKCFTDSNEALYYLIDTTDKPFLIICDLNIPVMDGLELRRKINESDRTRKKSIPFIFFTTFPARAAIEEAYEMMVQGYFKKPNSIQEIKETLKTIVNYWLICLHPNN
jgi:CheY-like chemotaxis protein